jgi:hypothetical protein
VYSCRRDPIKFKILYHNLSSGVITKETGLAEFGMIDQYNCGLSTNDQLCYQHEDSNDDVAYWKVLLDTAEQFFNRRIKELKKVCFTQLIEALISGSISSQLTKDSILDSNAVLPIEAPGNEKEDTLQ